MRDKDIKDAFEVVSASDELKQTALSAALKAAKPAKKKPRLMLAVAAVAAVFVLAVGGYGMYMQPSAYISVDVNPSIELALNKANKVVGARAHNRDGENILSSLELEGDYYEDAIDRIMDKEFEAGYLGDDAYVVFAIQSDDPSQEQELMEGTQQCAETHHGNAQTECMSVSAETREEAHHHGMSPGKYQTFLDLQEVDPTVTIEDSHHMSMHDMKSKIDECSQDHGANHEEDDREAEDHEVQGHGTEEHGADDNETHNQGSGHGH